MARMRVRDAIFDREEDIRREVKDFYAGLFREEGDWRPRVDGWSWHYFS